MLRTIRVIFLSLLSLLTLSLLTCGALAADTEGYIVCVQSDVTTFSQRAALPDGIEELCAPEGLYTADSQELVEELDQAGVLIYAEPDYIITLDEAPDDPALAQGKQWELSMMGMDYVWDNEITGVDSAGNRVRVGIVDSGLYAQHSDLAQTTILDGYNYCAGEDAADTTDTVGHGTAVAGIIAASTGNGIGIAGMAPDVELVPLKCFTGRGGKLSDVVAAIYGGVDTFGCQVLNMSFGLTQDSLALRQAVAYAADQGVILVAAVGNDGTNEMKYPAAYSQVIGVGAVDSEKNLAAFSQQNKSVFIAAPGKGVYGLSVTGPDAFTTLNGTSYSAPMVTAAAALALSIEPELTQAQFEDLLQETAEDLGQEGYDTSYGYGLLRVDSLLSALRKGWRFAWTEDSLSLTAWQAEIAADTPVWAVAAAYSSQGQLMDVTALELVADGDGVLSILLPRPTEEAALWTIMLLDHETYAPLCLGHTLS